MTLDPSDTRAMILEALRKNGGNRGKAAESIGVPVRTFYRWIAQFARWEVEALTAEMASDGTLDRETASATGHGPTREEVRQAFRAARGDRDEAARQLGLCVRRAVALARAAGVKVAPVRKTLRA
jgi:DNA-binding NtrC family response regulator